MDDDIFKLEAEQLWLDEAERRLAAFRRGETTAIPGDKVFGELLKRA
jgi:hypothetical protein